MILGAGAVSDGTQRMLCRGELIDPGQSDEILSGIDENHQSFRREKPLETKKRRLNGRLTPA
jgi:hypothetical protein